MTEHKDYLVSKVSMVVTNAQEIVDLLKKAQQQIAGLETTLEEINLWTPDLNLEKPIQNLDHQE